MNLIIKIYLNDQIFLIIYHSSIYLLSTFLFEMKSIDESKLSIEFSSEYNDYMNIFSEDNIDKFSLHRDFLDYSISFK